MTGEIPKDYEEITSFLGEYGFFQVVVFVLLSVSAIPSGYNGVIVVFIADIPQHHCRQALSPPQNGSQVEELSFQEQSSRIGSDSCSRYKNSTETDWLNETEPCVDGWVFSTDIYTSTIVSEWDLVCDNAWKVPVSTSIYFVGSLVGSFITGHLSDRYGRKPVLIFTAVLQMVITLIQATSINWIMFCILNFLRGGGQMTTYITSLVLGSEILTQSARVTFNVLGITLGFGIGYALLPLFAYFIRGWRMLLVATAMPGFLVIPMWWVIPESPRWLLHQGRVDEAELVIRKAARMNKVTAPDAIFKDNKWLELMQNKSEEEEEQRIYTWMDLFRTTNMRNITFISGFLWALIGMVFFGMSLNTSNMNGDVFLNCFIAALTDIVAYVLSWLLINRSPRPTMLFSTLLFCGIMLLIIMLVPEDMHAIFQTLVFLGKLGMSGAYAFICVFTTELVPTVVRNMGLGIASTAARMGSIICPFVIYIGVYSKVIPYIVFGTISIMGAVLSLLLPDTRNSKLPDLIDQVKPIRGYCCCSPKKCLQDVSVQRQPDNTLSQTEKSH
ncbi:hypothetical protein LDENG_00297500 [Lucifuga dentata]|nr:hypothetical protein LDENG_00297500 [Lucifuga dentata]